MAAQSAAATTAPPDADDDAAALRAALAGVRSRWDATHAASKAPFAAPPALFVRSVSYVRIHLKKRSVHPIMP